MRSHGECVCVDQILAVGKRCDGQLSEIHSKVLGQASLENPAALNYRRSLFVVEYSVDVAQTVAKWDGDARVEVSTSPREPADLTKQMRQPTDDATPMVVNNSSEHRPHSGRGCLGPI